MAQLHNLGYPRIGAQRELKRAQEAYWAGEIDAEALADTGKMLRERHWHEQSEAGIELLPVGDFAWYDQVLEWTTTLGVVPARFGQSETEPVSLDTLFRMARGRAPSGSPVQACDMTKWFDTNYHFLVPEITPAQTFRLARTALFDQVAEAQALGFKTKPVIPGPLTWLGLARGDAYGDGTFDANKLALLDDLLVVYGQVLAGLAGQGVEWVQLDEPLLVLDLPESWRQAYIAAYQKLADSPLKLMVTTYFGDVLHNLDVVRQLPVAGLHIDVVRGSQQLKAIVDSLGATQVLSVGCIDGRNIWRADLDAALAWLRPLAESLGDRLWLAPSCSLLHVPVDLELESQLDPALRSWLAFARQKLHELGTLAGALRGEAVDERLQDCRNALARRHTSSRIHHPDVATRLQALDDLDRDRSPFTVRRPLQQRKLALPAFPTTTIGSFPQTPALRQARRDWRNGGLSDAGYQKRIRAEIESNIRLQEEIGLDVLVHGEPERNDMVEYFGELLSGFAFTANGWVQSYGSRCVKPPVIFGDVLRPAPMTVGWTQYAQSLTDKPVKGMLTGPVTILQWSFVRDDQPRAATCRQIALALRDEIHDLQAAGISVIQIDEPAIREGLPLREADRADYLTWSVDCFRIAASVAASETQVHTHMCYSEFNDIIHAIAAMDADVITIETSRSNMALLEAFESFEYPNDIGPGVYDIHTPNLPDEAWMVRLVRKASERLPAERLWVNPDCGLKTRRWEETRPALEAMVRAARLLRDEQEPARAVA